MSGSCSQYSRKSLPERSALSPIVTNDEKPMPRAAAASIAALPNPPLCEAKPTSPGGGAAGATVASRAISGRGLATPRELGPTIRMPAARQTASSSSWRARPAGPTSAKPPVRTTRARTPLAAQARATSTTAFVGTTITASSTSPSTSAIVGTVGRPATSPPRTLTRCSGPENPAASRLRTTSPPTVPGRRDAPITATEDGRRTCPTAATSASRWRSSKRRRASCDSDVGNSISIAPSDRRAETRNPDSWNTPSIRWLPARTVAVNVSIPAVDAAWARCASRTVAIPWPCQASATAKATSARPAAPQM